MKSRTGDERRSWTRFLDFGPLSSTGLDLVVRVNDRSWDVKRYPKAPPFDGAKGVAFDNWERDLVAGIADLGDEDSPLEDTMYGVDAGGDDPAAPPAGSQAVQRRRAKRLRDLYGILYRHVENDDLRLMASALRRDGRQFWLMLERECRKPITDLELIAMDHEWSQCSILLTVGYVFDSVTAFSRHLQKLNARRPVANRKSLSERCTKVLSSLSAVELFSVEALKELQADAGSQRFVFPAGHAQAGQRDYSSLVTHFDSLWRAAFEKGLIKKQVAGKSSSGTTIDAFSALSHEVEGAHIVQRADGSDVEKVCYRCLGAGHTERQCASDVRSRSFRGQIALLTALMNRGGTPRAATRSPWVPRASWAARSSSDRPAGPPGGGRDARAPRAKTPDKANIAAEEGSSEDARDAEDESEESVEGASAVECDPDWFDPCLDLSEQPEGVQCVTCTDPYVDLLPDPPAATQPKGQSSVWSLMQHARPATAIMTVIVAVVATLLQHMRGCSIRGTAATFICCLAVGEAARTSIPVVESALNTPVRGGPMGDGRSFTGWVVDCGATKHCVPLVHDLSRVDNTQPNVWVRVANGTLIKATATGSACVPVTSTTGPGTLHLSNVLVVPGLTQRLFSCKHGFERDGIRTHLNDELALALPNGRRVPLSIQHNQYMVGTALETASTIAAGTNGDPIDYHRTHARLAHFSQARVRAAANKSIVWAGTDLSLYHHDRLKCPDCLANAPRKPFKRKAEGREEDNEKATPSDRKNRFGWRVSSDLCGPFPESVLSNFTYAIVFVDHATKWVATYYLKNKLSSSVRAAFEQYLADHKQYLEWNGGTILHWRTDNGGEFESKDLDEFLTEMCVTRSFSVPYAPPTNAHAERAWGTVLRPTRVMLAACGLPQSFWPFAMHYAVRVHNSLPSRGLTPLRSSYEALTGQLPDLKPLKVFGCRCFTHLEGLEDHPAGGKLNSTSVEAIHLGVDPKRRGWMVYIPSLRRVTTSRNVDFQEDRFRVVEDGSGEDRSIGLDLPSKLVRRSRSKAPGGVAEKDQVAPPKPPKAPRQALPTVRLKLRDPTEDNTTDGAAQNPTEPDPESGERASYFAAFLACIVGASAAVGFASSYVDRVFAVKASEGPIPIPKTYREAMASKHAKQWREAMAEEVQGKMSHNKAWNLISRNQVPSGRRVLRGKWVYDLKYNPDGSVKRFKARWVGCGYAQQEGIDYDLTYASTLRATSFRILMAVAAYFGLVLRHIDVTKAFTQARLDDVELYVEQPEGFAEPGKVCHMLMALEGLKQSAHLWQKACADFLVGLGFYRLEHEPCLFRFCVGAETLAQTQTPQTPTGRNKVAVGMCIIVGCFVDDLVCAFPPASRPLFVWFEYQFSKRFKCTPSDVLSRFMGIEITRDDATRSISLSQTSYITSMVDKYLVGVHTKFWSGPVGSSTAELDAFMSLKPAADAGERARVSDKEYMSLVGSLLYAACMTRPDIAYHCAVLGQYMQDPSMACLDAARGVLAYLGKTKHYKLTYGPMRNKGQAPYFSEWQPGERELYCFFDSSWGRAPTAMSGHVVMFVGAAVSWSARKLKLIPLSSCEAETACGSVACRDLRFIQLVLNELSQPGIDTLVEPETRVITDAQSARDVVENPGVTARTRHYERWVHYMRYLASRLHIRMQLVRTTAMLADIFTKAVGRSELAAAARVLLNLW